MPAMTLNDLQAQISQREQELQALREQLQARQGHLDKLTRRKEQLQTELRQVEQAIVAATTKASAAGPVTPADARGVASPAATAHADAPPRLGELIVTMLQESNSPRTGRQLLEEAQRRGYQTKSLDPLKTLENRLQDLKSKGLIRRAAGQYGFVLASSTNGASKKKNTAQQPAPAKRPTTPVVPAQPEPAAKKNSGKEAASAEASKPARVGPSGEQPSLRETAAAVLKSSRKPLSTRELAERIRATGYRSGSPNFVKVVGTMLGKMDNVEHVPQQGYRLKRP